jgi:outer membrane protein OmpA-like peptidoglycan-associated protein
MGLVSSRCILSGILLFSSVFANAVSYYAPMNHAEWNTESSPFSCKMWQPIPIYGDAVFEHKAGEKQAFFLNPKRPEMRVGKASLVSIAPIWDEQRYSVNLGYVPVGGKTHRVRVGSALSYRLLTELYEGMSPVFTRQSAYAKGVKVKVAVSSVNFRKAYSQYQDCLAQLLPVNFEQIARSRLHFNTAKWDLTPATQERLDVLIRYVRADPSVTSFFIDGHTDNVGRRLANLDLSKSRAETVTKYLVANGVDAALITTRYHGERFPVTVNSTRKKRAQNRRVTLRLERDGL